MDEQPTVEQRANRIVANIIAGMRLLGSKENGVIEQAVAAAKVPVLGEILEAEKQGQAEVLAACLKKLKEHQAFVECRKQKHDDIRFGELMMAISAIEALQPAAKALEELLREARLDEAKWWEHLSQESHEQHPPYENCMYCTRIAELEKACASEGKE